MSIWLRNLSIGRRLIVIITGINLAIILLIGLIAMSSNRRALESQTTRNFADKNQQVTQAISDELEKVMDTTNQIQFTLSTMQTYSQSQLRSSMIDIISQDEDTLIHRISVYRPSGTSIDDESEDSVVVFQILQPRTGVINETRTLSADNQQPSPDAPQFSVIESSQPTWFIQEIAFQDTQGLGAVSLAMPYVFVDDTLGVVWVDIPTNVFNEMVSLQLNRSGLLADTVNGFALLLNEHQQLIHTYGEQTAELNSDSVSEIIGSLSVEKTVDNLNLVTNPWTNNQDFAAINIIPLNEWQILSVLPQDDIPQPSSVLILQLFLVAIVGICVIYLAVSYFTKHTIIVPLRNLSQVAEEIGTGDLRYHIGYQRYQDEIGFLARAMERMKGNIATSYDELRAWSRTLELRVDERTRELNETRKEAEAIANELRAVYDESLAVVNEPLLEPILEAFTQRILSLMNASYCSIWLLDDREGKLRLVTNTHDPTFDDIQIDTTQGLVGQSVQQQSAIIVKDYSQYEHRISLPQQNQPPYVQAMVAPLMFDGNPMGAVFVGRLAHDEKFTYIDTRRLTLFANLVSPAVRNAQLFNQREAARQEAERANQVKTRFLASVTHELRTPLNLIINNMDFMRIGAFGDVTEEQVSRLNQTVRSAEHLLYLINDLLDVSKIEAGEMQLFIQPTDVMTIVEDSIDSTYAFIEKIEGKEEQVSLITEIDDDMPKIPMDARRIRQVLLNLLSNAVKFTDEGEVKLTVNAQEQGIYFAVNDTGMGIPKDEYNKLFEVFARTTDAKEQNIEGTGLGLPISQYLIQQHGGVLEVDSVVGRGTTFMFTIPYISTDGVLNPTESPITSGIKTDE